MQKTLAVAALAAVCGCATADPADAPVSTDGERRRSVVVVVENPDGTPLAGAPVAFYDEAQRLRAEVKTDGAGHAASSVAGAVSVGRVLPSGEREITTFLDVRPGDRLLVRTPAPDPPSGDRTGAVATTRVLFPAAVPGAARYAAATACGEGSAPAGDEAPAVTVEHLTWLPCADPGGELTVVGAALDAAGEPLAFASGVATLGAGPVQLGAYESPVETTLQPSGKSGYPGTFQAAMTVTAVGGAIPAEFWHARRFVEDEPLPERVRFLAPASLGATTGYDAWLGTGIDGDWYGYYVESRWHRDAAAGAALPVSLWPILDRVHLERQGGAPAVEWHAVTPLGPVDSARITVDWRDGDTFHVWNIVLAGQIPSRIVPPAPSPFLADFAIDAPKYGPDLRWLTFTGRSADGTRVTKWERDSQ